MAKNAVIKVKTSSTTVEEIYPITKQENILGLNTDDPAIPTSDVNNLFTNNPVVEDELKISDYYTKTEVDFLLANMGTVGIKLKKW